jgi:hypothetical protein
MTITAMRPDQHEHSLDELRRRELGEFLRNRRVYVPADAETEQRLPQLVEAV